MKRLTPIPPDSVAKLKSDSETGIGYQVVSVTLKDGRNFDQAVASEGYVIQVRGYEDVPFTQVDRLPLQLIRHDQTTSIRLNTTRSARSHDHG
jgi:hypothetical protein